MKLNRKMVMVLALVLSVAMATSGTMAYLSDTDSDVNVMTLGNVDIEQIEEKRDENGDLIDYPSHPGNQPLFPAVGDLAATEIDLYGTKLNVWNNANVLDKFVTVENTGKSDAFVRTVFAVEDYEDDNTLLQLNWSEEDWTAHEKFADGVEITDADGDTAKYDLYVVYYKNAEGMAPKTTSLPSLMQVAMPKTADNDDMAKYGSTMNILVVTQAMQTAGFTTAEAALNEGFYTLSATSHPWTNGIENPEIPPQKPITTAKELVEALSNKQISNDLVLSIGANIDMSGETFAAAEINDGASVTVVGNGYTISNLDLVAPTPAQNGMNNVGMFHLDSEYGKGGASLTISNLTFKNASYNGNAPEYCDAAVVVGYANTGSIVNLNNVDIVNGDIKNANGNAALLVGYTVAKVNLTDCDVSGTVQGERADKTGAFIGTANTSSCAVTIDNCVNNTNANNFGRVINGATTNGPATQVVSTSDELVGALEAGDNIILNNNVKIDPAGMSNAYGTTGINVKNGQTINGNGHTLDIKGAGGTWDSGINTTGGVIKNLTVTGSFRGIFINHNSTHSETVVLENVTIDGTTYTISCDQGMYQNLEAYNSTFNGWTSYAATLGTAKFVDCYFGEGSGYAYCRPYAPTEFEGCEFETGFKIDPRATVTFKNCKLDGVEITAQNLDTLVTSNITNATVK